MGSTIEKLPMIENTNSARNAVKLLSKLEVLICAAPELVRTTFFMLTPDNISPKKKDRFTPNLSILKKSFGIFMGTPCFGLFLEIGIIASKIKTPNEIFTELGVSIKTPSYETTSGSRIISVPIATIPKIHPPKKNGTFLFAFGVISNITIAIEGRGAESQS